MRIAQSHNPVCPAALPHGPLDTRSLPRAVSEYAQGVVWLSMRATTQAEGHNAGAGRLGCSPFEGAVCAGAEQDQKSLKSAKPNGEAYLSW